MSLPSVVRGAAGSGLRIVVGDGPARLIRCADRFAFEVLQLLAATQAEVSAVNDTTDTLVALLERLDGRVAALEDSITRTQTDVAQLRADVDDLRGLLPGDDDDAGPIERVRKAVSG